MIFSKTLHTVKQAESYLCVGVIVAYFLLEVNIITNKKIMMFFQCVKQFFLNKKLTLFSIFLYIFWTQTKFVGRL